MTWKKCSNCKKEIGFGQQYYQCSVTSCNHERTGFQFCSVSCWSGHVPILRHKDAWAVEAKAPQFIAVNSSQSSATSPSASSAKAVNNTEVLVVVSKLKSYIKEVADMNTSADVMDTLSDKLRKLCDNAIQKAKQDNRKTVMARDF